MILIHIFIIAALLCSVSLVCYVALGDALEKKIEEKSTREAELEENLLRCLATQSKNNPQSGSESLILAGTENEIEKLSEKIDTLSEVKQIAYNTLLVCIMFICMLLFIVFILVMCVLAASLCAA